MARRKIGWDDDTVKGGFSNHKEQQYRAKRGQRGLGFLQRLRESLFDEAFSDEDYNLTSFKTLAKALQEAKSTLD